MSDAPRTGLVLVTGAGSGAGRAIALHLNERGWLVVAGLRRIEGAEGLRAAARHPDNIVPLALDLARPAEIERAAVALAELGAARNARFAGIVNNAAAEVRGPLELIPEESYRQGMEVGFFGLAAITRAVLPLARRDQGRIIIISSVNGRSALKWDGLASAVKHAAEAYANALRMELRPWRLPVIVIEPGPMRTPLMLDKLEADFNDRLRRCPREKRDQYFPDFERAVMNVRAWRKRLETPAPQGPLGRLGALLAGRFWLDSPLDLARLVEKALVVPRPRRRYVLGLQAKTAILLRRVLSDRLFERVVGEDFFRFS